MASATGELSEPHVLAHAKRRLFPDESEESAYAVVDTQFAADSWLSNQRIDPEVKKSLAPFNHVHIGSGYPDLVGVRTVESDLLSVERLGDEPPLIVVEAKGYSDSERIDVERGVVQAYDRLHEANVAFVAAPIQAVSQSARTLARELNVGVLGVRSDGHVEPIERPRVVGNRTTTEATAIRFQASAQGVANKSFSLNHPKNYLAYPLAVYHSHDTERVLTEHVVGAVDGAREGAAFLGLIDERHDGVFLTPLGREVVRFSLREYGTVDDALAEFANWKRSRKRFTEIAPRWGMLTRRIVFAYPATQLLIEELQCMYQDGIAEPSLVELITYLHERHPSFTVELFVRGDNEVRERVFASEGALRRDELLDGSVYHSPTVFQLKAILYHAGILTERGAEPTNLNPTADIWALREPLSY